MKTALPPAHEVGGGGWSRRAWPVLGAAILAALAIETGRWGMERWRTRTAIEAVFADLMAAPTRPFAARLTHPLAAGHRPPGGACAALSRGPRPDSGRLMAFERARDGHGLASAHALSCDPTRARRTLQELAPSLAQRSDLAALMVDDPDARDAALRLLDEILREHPQHPQALFNRGLILAGLELPRAAIRSFAAAASLGEPGWADEARTRADELKATLDRRAREKAELQAQLEGLRRGQLPSQLILDRHPEHVRIAFEKALGEAPADRAAMAAGVELDRHYGTQSFARMARGALELKKAGTSDNGPREKVAGGHQRRAIVLPDTRHELHDDLLRASALSGEGQRERAVATYRSVLLTCSQLRMPVICAEARIRLANLLIELYRLQPARDLLLSAKREAAAELIDGWDAQADRGLARLGAFRQERSLSGAYAEELSLRDDDCKAAIAGRSGLAELAALAGDYVRARAQLMAAKPCGSKWPVLEHVGLNVLANLIREDRQPSSLSLWFDESLAAFAGSAGGKTLAGAGWGDLYAGRAWLGRDPRRARAHLERVIARFDDTRDAAKERLRMQAHSTLATSASSQGRHAAVFEALASALRIEPPKRCAIGLASDSGWYALAFRTADGTTAGIHEGPARIGTTLAPRVFDSDPTRAEVAIPASVMDALRDCQSVDVLAPPTFFGRPRLLPAHVAWSYRFGAGGNRPPEGGIATEVRLIVHDVAIPSRFGLPRLNRQRIEPFVGERVVSLAGREATPAAVLAQLPSADLIEIHAHGLLDREISDAPALVLAEDDGGEPLLDAGAIESLVLPRRPGVVLGACDVGRSARYWSYSHGMPSAFLRAGARFVIASPSPVEDAAARPFFESVWRRVREGAPLAKALRDERRSPRWQSESDDWTRDVVAFQ